MWDVRACGMHFGNMVFFSDCAVCFFSKQQKTLILDIHRSEMIKTIKGIITILNNLVLAPLIYVSSVIDTQEKVIKEVDTIIQNVIWDGKTANISKNT